MPAGPIIRVLAPPIGRALVAAGRAGWAWMTSSEGAVVVGSATATAVAIKGQEAARAKAEQWLRDNVGPDVCLSCAVACQALACGVPGSPYRGGAHWCMRLPIGDSKDSHHSPAKAAYMYLPPGAGFLPPDLGPAIQMDPADHLRTATNTFGNPTTAPGVIAAQSLAIASGNFIPTQIADIADVLSISSKYQAATLQMTAYTACMKSAGAIK